LLHFFDRVFRQASAADAEMGLVFTKGGCVHFGRSHFFAIREENSFGGAARFFLVQFTYLNGKMYQINTKLPNGLLKRGK
jgi:hypothetical protein